MSEFLFVRHGETEMNTLPHLVGGQSNHTPLTERGIQQAEDFGTHFGYSSQFRSPDVIFSSGAVRTNATARHALGALGIESPPFIEDERLLEVSQGPYEGKLRREVYTPENIKHYNLNALDGKLPGGESILDAQIRIQEFLRDTYSQYPEHTVMVFSHGLAIRSLAGAVLGYTKQQILHDLETPNLSMTVIDVIDYAPNVRFVGKHHSTGWYN